MDINTRLLTYDIKVRPNVSNRLRVLGFKDTQCLGVVVTNLLACIRKGNRLVYSRSKVYNPNSSKKKITPYRVIKAMDFLEKIGYIHNHIGVGHRDKELREISYVEPTEKFLSEWTDAEVQMMAEIDYLESNQVIELRDSNKNSIPYRNSEHIARMADTVRALNRMNESSIVKDGDGNVLTNIYCRIFNESFDFGGRFYRADVLAIKNKGTNDRLRITIDDKPVCEVDYSNLHFRIAAALEDLDAEDIPLDVYSGILEDESNLVDRGMVKLAVNMLFNCWDEGQALKAIQREINLMSKEDRAVYTLGNALSVVSLVRLAYPAFEYLFCNSASFGRVLQNADSHLASDILEIMIEKKIPCLPIHDSFIVPLEHLDFLCDTMGDCFRKRFNWNSIVPVGLKYLHDGKVMEDKICV